MFQARPPIALLLLAALAAAPGLADGRSGDASVRAPETEREKALHALSRLAFGPRPGDVDRVVKMGVSAWIESQLRPETIPDSAMPERLATLPTLSMSSREIFEEFEAPVLAARRERRAALAGSGSESGGPEAPSEREIAERIPPEKRPRRVIEELSSARVMRAVFSERQLNEVLVDFWMNHFNVYAAKGLDRVLVTSFERDTVRPRIWGRFDDLLLATAKSPAMLFYLDNAQSVADADRRPTQRPSAGARWWAPGGPMTMPEGVPNPRRGLNENYARELMELHTLGVDGGYSQRDVTELARVLTGWSIDQRQSGEFVFRPRVHDAGAKTVLGHFFPAGEGIEEGEKMIRILAHQPATAHHLSFELCQRLVADQPPTALVERVAKTFLTTDGDLRRTVRAVVESPEFFDRANYRAKVKSPFEYVVSAVRAAGGDTDARLPLLRQIGQMGEPLYLCQPPTGYSDASTAWVSTGALVARLNFALALAGNRLPGTSLDFGRLIAPEDASDPKRSVDALARALVGGDLSAQTRQTIEKRIGAQGAPGEEDASERERLTLIAGLILGSPEFQRQ